MPTPPLHIPHWSQTARKVHAMGSSTSRPCQERPSEIPVPARLAAQTSQALGPRSHPPFRHDQGYKDVNFFPAKSRPFVIKYFYRGIARAPARPAMHMREARRQGHNTHTHTHTHTHTSRRDVLTCACVRLKSKLAAFRPRLAAFGFSINQWT